jgi:hypothetical protein
MFAAFKFLCLACGQAWQWGGLEIGCRNVVERNDGALKERGFLIDKLSDDQTKLRAPLIILLPFGEE